MRKEINTTIYWGAALAGSLGLSYAAHDVLEEAIIEPRVNNLQTERDELTICIDELQINGIQPGVVSEIPEVCEIFTADWAESDHSLTGSTTSVVNYLVPSYSVLENEVESLDSKRDSVETAAWPFAALVGGVSLFAAYGIKQNFEEFH